MKFFYSYLLSSLGIFAQSCSTSKDTTEHKKIYVYDTIRVRVVLRDTVYVVKTDTVHKTTTVTDTQYSHVKKTITVFDTVLKTVNLFDTIKKTTTITDTLKNTVTITLRDTIFKTYTKTDTIRKTISITDTSRKIIYVTDTSFRNIIIRDTTKVGVLVNNMTIDQQINVSKSLNVKYVRNATLLKNWSGNDGHYERYVAAGFKVLYNINWDVQGTPFVTDTTLYKSKLVQVLTKYKPEVAVIENEETNLAYHSGPLRNYINQLKAAVTVCRTKGVQVTNGGIHPQGLCYFVYLDYMERGLTTKAQEWMSTAMNSAQQFAAKHPERTDGFFQTYWRRIDTLLKAYKSLDLDYINIHFYEPLTETSDGINISGNSIQIIADYVRRKIGKQVMSNEWGQTNLEPRLTKNMLLAFKEGNYKYAINFSGDGEGGALALNNRDGTLRETGIMFKQFKTF